jgi:hypothetical protein
MDFRRHLRVGAGTCLCIVGLGVMTEIAHFAHAPGCPMLRREVIMCGTGIEIIMPEHVHSSEVSTPRFSRGALASNVGTPGVPHAVRLGEGLYLSDNSSTTSGGA